MAKDNDLSDELLVAALRMDSHEAFIRIFRLCYADLVVFCSRFIDSRAACEDIVQDVFVKIWEERHTLRIRSSLRSYLTALVQNRAIDQLRRDSVKDRYLADARLHILAQSPEEHIFFSELDSALSIAIDRLPPPLRDTIVLRMSGRLTQPQIARQLGISTRTVEQRMAKALRLIRETLKHFKACTIILSSLLCDYANNHTGLWI